MNRDIERYKTKGVENMQLLDFSKALEYMIKLI